MTFETFPTQPNSGLTFHNPADYELQPLPSRPSRSLHSCAIEDEQCRTTSQFGLLNLCLSRWFSISPGTSHRRYISFYDASELIHHPLMTSYSTGLVRGAVYSTTALMRPIFISIFGNKTVMLFSINNLSRFLCQAAISWLSLAEASH